jgi:hypothetical protein
MDKETINNKLIPLLKSPLVVNGAVASFLLDHQAFEFIKPSPDQNASSGSKYVIGKLNGFAVIVDPCKKWTDLTVHDEKGILIEDLSKHAITTEDLI